MTATDDTRLALDMASKSPDDKPRAYYLDQARTLALLAVAEAIHHHATEVAALTEVVATWPRPGPPY